MFWLPKMSVDNPAAKRKVPFGSRCLISHHYDAFINVLMLSHPPVIKDASCESKETKSGRHKLETWLNKSMKIKMSDGRYLIGVFLCTDRDRNVILGSCDEYIHEPENGSEEPRVLGLAMVPGCHIQAVFVDEPIA